MRLAVPFLLCGLATAQSTSSETFRDPQNGVSFRYPATWPRMEAYGAVLEGKDGDRVIAAFSRRLDGGTRNLPVVKTSSFVYSILAANDVASCKKRAEIPSDLEPPRGPDSPVINGLQFAHGSAMSAGAGHSSESDAYTIFRNDRCYGFEIVADTENIDHLRSRGADIDPALILKTVNIGGLGNKRLPESNGAQNKIRLHLVVNSSSGGGNLQGVACTVQDKKLTCPSLSVRIVNESEKPITLQWMLCPGFPVWWKTQVAGAWKSVTSGDFFCTRNFPVEITIAPSEAYELKGVRSTITPAFSESSGGAIFQLHSAFYDCTTGDETTLCEERPVGENPENARRISIESEPISLRIQEGTK